MTVRIWEVPDLPEINNGDDLAALIAARLESPLQPYDVIAVTSKVVSKAAGLVVTGEREQLIDEATDRVVARKGQTRIVRTHHGLTMAAAGLDASNTKPGTVVRLPEDPDADAARLRSEFTRRNAGLNGRLGVVITDTAGRAWRNGQTEMAIGAAGIVALRSYAGAIDPYGNELRVTAPAIADEIASAVEIVAGKLDQSPVTIVRGLEPRLFTTDDGPGAATLIRPEADDLFGLGAHEAVHAALAATSGRPRGFPVIDGDPAELVRLALDGLPAVLDTDVRAASDHIILTAAGREGSAHDEVLVAIGALLERLRILCRAHGATLRHEPIAAGRLIARLPLR